jgi:hypothetical protein
VSDNVRSILALAGMLTLYGLLTWAAERQRDTSWEMSPRAVFARLNRSTLVSEEMMETADGPD